MLRSDIAVRIRKMCFYLLVSCKFSIKTIIHVSSKIDGYRIFSSIRAKKERAWDQNQKNLLKKDATLEKSTILI